MTKPPMPRPPPKPKPPPPPRRSSRSELRPPGVQSMRTRMLPSTSGLHRGGRVWEIRLAGDLAIMLGPRECYTRRSSIPTLRSVNVQGQARGVQRWSLGDHHHDHGYRTSSTACESTFGLEAAVACSPGVPDELCLRWHLLE